MRSLAAFLDHKLKRILIATGLACLSVSAFAGPALTPHSAEYIIKISVLGGKLNTQFQITEDGYVAESVIRQPACRA